MTMTDIFSIDLKEILETITSIWNSEIPYIDSVVNDTLLTPIPTIFLCVALILDLCCSDASNKPIRRNCYNTSRLILLLCTVTVRLVECLDHIYIAFTGTPVERNGHRIFDDSQQIVISALAAPFVQVIGLLILLYVYERHRKQGRHSSGITWFFLLFSVILGGPDLYETVTNVDLIMIDGVDFVTRLSGHGLMILLFIWDCVGDRASNFYGSPNDTRPLCHETEASFLSSITFCWSTGILWRGFKSPITLSSLWQTQPEDRANHNAIKFERKWASSTNKNTYVSNSGNRRGFNHIAVVITKIFGSKLLFAGSLKLVQDSLQFVIPMMLKSLLNFMSDKSEPNWHGLIYAGSLLIFPTIQSLVLGAYFNRMNRIGMQIRSLLITSIYRKSLILGNSSRQESTSGEIVNLMAVDTQRCQDLMLQINLLWSAPFQIMVSIYLLYNELGVSVFGGVFVMLIMIPINTWVSSLTKQIQINIMKAKDERIKQMNEILAGMKVLKLYAWENSFMKEVIGTRAREIEYLRRLFNLDAFAEFAWQCSPFLVALLSFFLYIIVDEHNVLDAEKAFVSISLFNVLQFPMHMLPRMMTSLITALVSIQRINKFLNSDELQRYVTNNDEPEAIVIEDGHVMWGTTLTKSDPKQLSMNGGNAKQKPSTLRNINMRVKPGQFVAIVGQVASGKTSLLCAILGEMQHVRGRFNVNGSLRVAYVPQQAWIQNMSVRENILFGRPFDAERYDRVMRACALYTDMASLPAGDSSEIGEKGINLSGGQKQRVSLARACYADADIYLLDDPLSAVDSHVAKHLYDHVLNSTSGLLAGKTRILVTNNLFVLPYTDYLYVMEDGTISESGTYNELTSSESGKFADFMRQFSRTADNQDVKEKKDDPAFEEEQRQSVVGQKPNANAGTLIEKEHSETGRVKFSIYLYYFKSASYFWFSMVFILLVATNASNIGSNFWLSEWSSDSERNETRNDIGLRNIRLSVYGLLGLLQSAAVLGSAISFAIAAVSASKRLHFLMLGRIMHVPMQFFDTTPTGRIVNRFAKDIDVVDRTLPNAFYEWISTLLQVISTVIVISISYPSMLFIIMPLAIFYYGIQKIFIVTTRQLKRLESTTRSPIYSQFNETLSGVSVIRAYKCNDRFINNADRLVDINQSCCYPNVIANRWLSIRLEFFGNFITTCSALFAVWNRYEVSAGTAGLTISFAINLTQLLSWLVRMTSDLETNIVSVERIDEFVKLDVEDKWIKPESRPPLDWPDRGAIKIENYSTRYRPETDIVLSKLFMNIKPREKIGIVGRTGSGKSSLSLALFRILEPTTGRIVIDNVDSKAIGLHDLRSKLTIIPQDPVLFSGTLRFNLDPLHLYTDEEIWRSLDQAHLRSHIKALSHGLDSRVAEYGENFSVGQRQLICLARALLRKTKILVLDEATAAVDLKTDSLVLATIRKEFNDCTVITIAHRLHTILESDRVLVLEKGCIKEFDSPAALLANRGSLFAQLVEAAGISAQKFPFI